MMHVTDTPKVGGVRGLKSRLAVTLLPSPHSGIHLATTSVVALVDSRSGLDGAADWAGARLLWPDPCPKHEVVPREWKSDILGLSLDLVRVLQCRQACCNHAPMRLNV